MVNPVLRPTQRSNYSVSLGQLSDVHNFTVSAITGNALFTVSRNVTSHRQWQRQSVMNNVIASQLCGNWTNITE